MLSMDEAYLKAKEIKDIKERYQFIYDYMCDYLDNAFLGKNLCEFKDNTCGKERLLGRCRINACCNTKLKGGTCPNLINGRCSIKSISCKLHTCDFLRAKGVCFNIKDFPILKDNFNIRQKFHIVFDIFIDRDPMIDTLLKYRGIKMFRLF